MKPRPRSLEELLAEAAADETFGEDLLADRLGALEARGISLGEQEKKILLAIPDQQLQAVLLGLFEQSQLATEQAPPPKFSSQGIRPEGPTPVTGTRPGRHPGRILLATAAATALAGGGLALLTTHGARPDRPPEVEQPAAADAEKKAKDSGPD